MENREACEFMRCRRQSPIYAETSCEFSLPDYLGDVRKILLTDAQVRPAGKFSDGDGVELPGIVTYNVIYLDADGEISSAGFSSEYDLKCKYPSEGYCDAFADTELTGYSIRLTGPRKIMAKGNIKCNVKLVESVCATVTGSAFEEGNRVETATRAVNFENIGCSSVLEREYAEPLVKLEGAIADEVKVVYTKAEGRVDSISASEGAVTMKGELRVSAVIKNGDEPAYSVTRSIPVDETVPFDDVKPDSELLGKIGIASAVCSVNADDIGSEVVASVIAELSAIGTCNTRVDLITDAYMTACVTENIYDDMYFTELVAHGKERGGCQGEMLRSEIDAVGLREIVCMNAVAKIDSAEAFDNSITVCGNVQFYGICSTVNDDASSYIGVKIDAPFKQNVKFGCRIPTNSLIEPRVEVHGVCGTVDADKIYGSCDVTVDASVILEGRERVLSSSVAREELPFERRRSTVTVYYPESGETLFGIAKKFHTTSAAIAESNSLSEAVMSGGSDSVLSGVRRLMIYE